MVNRISLLYNKIKNYEEVKDCLEILRRFFLIFIGFPLIVVISIFLIMLILTIISFFLVNYTPFYMNVLVDNELIICSFEKAENCLDMGAFYAIWFLLLIPSFYPKIFVYAIGIWCLIGLIGYYSPNVGLLREDYFSTDKRYEKCYYSAVHNAYSFPCYYDGFSLFTLIIIISILFIGMILGILLCIINLYKKFRNTLREVNLEVGKLQE